MFMRTSAGLMNSGFEFQTGRSRKAPPLPGTVTPADSVTLSQVVGTR